MAEKILRPMLTYSDECHHAGAQTSEEVLNEVNAKYVYGLTATPRRDDGQEQKIFMQFGSIRYRYTAKDRINAQGISHYVIPRFTRLVIPDGGKMKVQEAYHAVVQSEVRNAQIIADVMECLKNGRTQAIDAMDSETFQLYLKYHFATCERGDLLGVTSHAVDIFKK